MSVGKKLVDELCQVVENFLCQPGTVIDLERCSGGPHVFSKGDSQAICTVKLKHGNIYNLEFVYKFWAHKLQSCKYPLCPFFIISNNGLAVTLKCFICEPRDAAHQFGECLSVSSDVNLHKNASVLLRQDDFIRFKTPLVFAKDLDIISSMVVCRTYLTDHRKSLQFLVVRAKNPRRISNILDMIVDASCHGGHIRGDRDSMLRRSIKERPLHSHSSDQAILSGITGADNHSTASPCGDATTLPAFLESRGGDCIWKDKLCARLCTHRVTIFAMAVVFWTATIIFWTRS